MEGNREVFFMKKKLSRLLCALLVMTMVLAMVPAVSAADGESASNPIVMYVGDETTETFGCTKLNHTTVVSYTNIFNGRPSAASTSNSFLTYNSTTRTFTARAASTSGSTFGVVQVDVSCKDASCDTAKTTRYYKIYSKANSIALKDDSGSNINGSMNIDTRGTNLYFTVAPTTSYVTEGTIKATIDDSSVATFGDGVTTTPAGSGISSTDYSKDTSGNTYFVLKAVPGKSSSTRLTITADVGTNHEKSTTITLITGTAGILTVKNSKNGKVLARSNYDEGEIETLNAAVNDTISLSATANSTIGKVSDVQWSSSDVKVAAITKISNTNGTVEFTVLGAGEAEITANLNGTIAKFKLSVLSEINKIRAVTIGKKPTIIDSVELKVNQYNEAAIQVMPEIYEESSKNSVVWTSSDTDVVYLDKDAGEYDRDTESVKGAQVKFIAKNPGKATIKATLGSLSYSFPVTVTKAAESITITDIPTRAIRATVRTGTRYEIVARMNANTLYNSIPAKYTAKDASGKDQIYATQVPVEWYDAEVASDGKSAKVRGNAMTTDGQNDYTYNCATAVTADVTLTDEAAVTDITITANKDNAIENDVVRLTANATVEPSSADVKYQWYANGKAISGATNRTVSYTIPKSSVDSSTEYKFTCEVTATYKGSSTSVESKPFVVTVSRDYTVSVTTTNAKSSYTVGDKVELKATLYYKGSAVSNSSFSWQLFDTGENVLDSGIATVTGNNATATVNTKGVKSAKGDRIVVRATVDYRGYSYSSSETITVNPASAATVKQSVGTGAALKSSAVTAAITKAAGSGAKISYLVFDTPRSCSLYKSASSSSSLGDTKCYVSTSSGQKLSDVYVKTSASSASVTYTAYDADDYVLATGTVSFDANDSDDTITSSGASFKAMAAVDQITEEYPEAEYVKLDLPRAREGKLYFDFNTISDFKREVKDSDKYYLNASSSQDDIEDVYFLPIYGVKGKVKLDYTAFSSSNSDLGSGTITVTVKSKTASSKFTDVTASNVGSWAADSIDFCADNDLVNGKSTYSFAPKDNLTRGQLVAILYRAAGSPSVTGTTNPFNDVKTGDYYYNAVLWAYKNDVVNGTGAGKFSPNANVTREQIAAILYRYMGSPAATGSLSGYTDRSKISAWATTAMQWAIGKGYITGTSSTTLDPLGQATRAQAAVMLHRFLTK